MNSDKIKSNGYNGVVGLIPAAGTASRLGPLPCSKEILPVTYPHSKHSEAKLPRGVGCYLLENMCLAGISKAYMILRTGKWDIPSYFQDGKLLGIPIAYLLMDLPFGVPYTLDQAYPFVKSATVAFGFPDILFEPADAFRSLLKVHNNSNATIVLGLFPSGQPHQADMVEFDQEGRLTKIHIKPDSTELRYAWIMAVWGPDFTDFMHAYVLEMKQKLAPEIATNEAMSVKELFIGDVIDAGIKKGLKTDSVIFEKGHYIDIGTPEDLVKMRNKTEFE